MLRKFTKSLFIIGAFQVSILTIEAVTPARDTFNYTASDPLNGQSGGTGWGTNVWEASSEITIQSGSVAAPPVTGYGPVPSDNSAGMGLFTPQAFQIAFQRIPLALGELGDENSLWASFLSHFAFYVNYVIEPSVTMIYGPYLSETPTLPTSLANVAAVTVNSDTNSRLNICRITRNGANYHLDFFSTVTDISTHAQLQVLRKIIRYQTLTT
jgi:hypothetical protein